MMKVVQIQYSPESGARSALRLQNAFIQSGIESSIVSLQHGSAGITSIIYLGKWQRLIARMDAKIQGYLLRRKYKEFGLFSFPVLGSDISRLPVIKEADIIYIHWALGGFLNWRGSISRSLW
jgi:hypothetical protein